jgi:hypothetical protein
VTGASVAPQRGHIAVFQGDPPAMATPQNSDAPLASSADDVLLDLDTLVKRPVIAIDGVKFEILSPNELSILDSHKFGIWGRRIQVLANLDGEEEEAELERLVDRLARRVSVGVPDDAYAKLSGSHKFAITDVFTGLLLRNRLGVAEAIAKAAGIPLTGVLSSLGSSGSTAAAPNGGWLKRLLPWFGRS